MNQAHSGRNQPDPPPSWKMWLRIWYVLPYASLPALLLYSASLPTFPLEISMLLRPALITSGTAALLVLALGPLASSLERRAVFVAGLCLGLGSFVITITSFGGYWLRTAKPVPILAGLHLILGLSLGAVLSAPSRASGSRKILEVSALTIVLTTAIQAVLAGTAIETWKAAADRIVLQGSVRLSPVQYKRPDVVHVILDGLGNPGVLSTYYGLDIQADVRRLEGLGFSVAPDARSNYVHTYSSIASLLNASYLDPLASLAHVSDRRPLQYLIRHSGVIGSLKDGGYHIVNIGSSYSATSSLPIADEELCASMDLNELESALYRYSPLRLFTLERVTYEPFRSKIRCQLNAVATLRPTGRPRYVLAHLIVPHPPFAFAADGGPAPQPRPIFGMQDADDFPGSRDAYIEGYREQARFVLSQLHRVVAALVSSNPGAIVILSGDHGPGSRFAHESRRASDLRERLGTFVAVRLPGGRAPQVVPRTLVNLYRFVYREGLDLNVELLPDRTVFTTFSFPYAFEELGTEVNHGTDAFWRYPLTTQPRTARGGFEAQLRR